ncbi:putative protein-serine/threonine phosphatase NDAI_0A03710 [Naumovozyma dairenensis CBS 421]|uniref:RNA polymerase II subunit B1 CTD phosphatase RPAP2 homolog n=1 Tax=Naumovozyma dairenensis (strain ATCC 10597 / BCRC 20456 / CBS 421 / NBRC 0211 / NRRL Y-12639) TaxID=1071378 RepID=G0W3Z0_NAUDC|nr:hypothetical protein NDAI_0A03710 [Naumovozyma dairenensis CBS 421]CCD22528.1 hypothetical protein NDAI_0A03710 [Naumovozyma dairenensis CBS 421]
MSMVVTIKLIQEAVLRPHQMHQQLAGYDADTIVYQLITLLINSNCIDETTLKYITRFFTPETFQMLVLQRINNKRCGYPLCDKPVSHINHSDAFSLINTKTSYFNKFCSDLHMKSTSFLQAQLLTTPLRERVGIHLISNYDIDKFQRENIMYNNIVLFEEYIREKTLDQDLDSIMKSLETLEFQI